jgi:uncharacterized protein YbaP (TraB family)
MQAARLLSLVTALLVAAGTSAADDWPLPLWQVDGDTNNVYLLGSVHLLRESDYPLSSAIYAAYDDAETLIMELDMDDLDPSRLQSLVTELGSIGDGGSLAELMGKSLYAEAEALAARANIPLNMLASVEPWLAAITVEQLMLQRIGFNPAFGVEAHFVGKAGRDGKAILGLEDIAEQLGFLDALSMSAQRDLLMQTLSEAVDIEPVMDGLVDAWRRGDTDYLEANMLEDMRAYPELYDAIVVDRNQRWTVRIGELLDDDEDYLVIVGTLHLVGDESVPALLEARGRKVRQLGETE